MEPHKHNHSHSHTHGVIDPSIVANERGLWVVKWSFIALIATALFQVVIVIATGSVALLADTIHNFADAATAIPLAIAFMFAKRKPNKRFNYGYGRVEDLAGVVVVFIILFSALFAGYQAIQRFFHPQPITHLKALACASVIGFLGNEGVALFRIKVGKQIGSAALIADGYHARTDGWTSLAVLVGAMGAWLGFPLADPIIGLLISVAIFYIVFDSAKSIFMRMLDGVDAEVLEQIEHAVGHVAGVVRLGSTKARWSGHRLLVEISITVACEVSVGQGHKIANEVREELFGHLPHLGDVIVHVDPAGEGCA